MKKALVTGVNGFVGPYLEKELIENGYEVFGLGTKNPDKKNYFCVDVTKEEELKEAVQEIKPDFIFHLAGVSSPPFAEKHPELTREVNVGGTVNLLEAALLVSTVPKLLIVSSSHVYGDPVALPIRESHPLSGSGVYAFSRIEQEKKVSGYMQKMPIVVTRSFNHTGPGQTDVFFVPKMVKQIYEIKKGERKILEVGNLELKRDISDVRDVVRAYRMLLEQDKVGVVCNVCSGEALPLKLVVDYLSEISGVKPSLDVKKEFFRINDPVEVCGDNSLLKLLTGWHANFNLKETIEDMYKFISTKL